MTRCGREFPDLSEASQEDGLNKVHETQQIMFKDKPSTEEELRLTGATSSFSSENPSNSCIDSLCPRSNLPTCTCHDHHYQHTCSKNNNPLLVIQRGQRSHSVCDSLKMCSTETHRKLLTASWTKANMDPTWEKASSQSESAPGLSSLRKAGRGFWNGLVKVWT